jgi:membrane protein
VRIAWRDVWVGAFVTAVLFSIGKLLIGLYIGKSGVTSGFGAAASVVALLVWVYWSAQIFLIGAEFTWVWAHRLGSRQGMASSAPSVDEGRMNEEER